jgi:hypothetical protein
MRAMCRVILFSPDFGQIADKTKHDILPREGKKAYENKLITENKG